MFERGSYRNSSKLIQMLVMVLLLVSSAGVASNAQAQSAIGIATTPVPIAPLGSITGVSKPTFVWSTYPGATSYRLAVFAQVTGAPLSTTVPPYPSAIGENFAVDECGFYIILENIPTSFCSETECSFPASPTFTNGDYKWKVLASTPDGVTEYSDWATFNITGVTIPAPAAAPTPTSPNGTVNTHRPTFTWNPVENASFYRLAVYSYDSKTYVVVENVYPSCLGGVCSYTPLTWDLVNGSYGFKLRSRNSSGYTDFGMIMKFSVSSNLPVAPMLLAPLGTASANPPLFQWNAVSGATQYRLLVYASAAGNYVIDTGVPPSACAGVVCTYTPGAALASGGYKFKMMTTNAYGNSGYSGFMSFIVP